MGVEIRIIGCCGVYLVPGTSGGEIILLHHIKVLNCFLLWHATVFCSTYTLSIQHFCAITV